MVTKSVLKALTMKSYNRFVPSVFMAIVVACAGKESAFPQSSVREAIITACAEGNPGTRTSLDTDYTTVLWMPKETISVFGAGEMAKFTSDNTEKAQVTYFKGNLPESYVEGQVLYGLYPYNPDAAVSDKCIR